MAQCPKCNETIETLVHIFERTDTLYAETDKDGTELCSNLGSEMGDWDDTNAYGCPKCLEYLFYSWEVAKAFLEGKLR